MSDDKNLPPSEHKIQEARKKGQVTVTQDAAKLFSYLIIMQMVFSSAADWTDFFDAGMNRIFHSIATKPDTWAGDTISHFTIGFATYSILFAVIAALSSLICTLFQTKFNIAPGAYESNLQKINPGNNLKNLISMQKIMMAGIGMIKVSIIAAVAWVNIEGSIPDALKIYQLSHLSFTPITIEYLSNFVNNVIIFVIVTTVLDYVVHYMQTYKSLKMDIKDMKDEYKQNEGDPHAKSHRKQEAKAMANEPFSVKKEEVSAVVVNPDHISVVLSYEIKSKLPPHIVRMGEDSNALEIRQHALRQGIPVIRFVKLARALYEKGSENERIPVQYMQAVALIIKMALDAKEGRPGPVAGEIYDLDAELKEKEAMTDSPVKDKVRTDHSDPQNGTEAKSGSGNGDRP